METEKGKKSMFALWRGILVIILALIFLVGTSYFNASTQTEDFVKWTSPDETANYIFAKLYAQEGRLSIPEKYNLLLKDIVRPRSFGAEQGMLKPMSFLGLPLFYGTIGSLTSYKVLPYLTPLMGAIGLIFFYLLIKAVFNKNVALLSTFFAGFSPVYIYYSSRSMFHNVLFLDFVIISLYFLVIMNHKKNIKYDYVSPLRPKVNFIHWLWAALGGAFMALAVATRTSEVIWLLPLLLLLWAPNYKKTGPIKPIFFVLAFVVVLIPFLQWNEVLNGAYWRTGYSQINNSFVGIGVPKVETFSQVSKASEFFNRVVDTIFSFGIKPRQSLHLFFSYLKLSIWLLPAAILGFGTWLWRFKLIKNAHIIYATGLMLVSIILIVYYGSWDFHDNPDASKITIGNSYTRYWLPIYFGLMPFAAILVINTTRLIKSYKLVWVTRFAVVLCVAVIGVGEVWAGSDEGLSALIEKSHVSREYWETVMSNTERNAVIVTRYHDKLMFPERKVIVGLFDDDNMIVEYAHIAKLLPTYYLNFTLPVGDVKYLNARKLKKVGLNLSEVVRVGKDFTLYKLSLNEK
ncbi:MAG: glycosyltransferase family 39 protein [bacterium]